MTISNESIHMGGFQMRKSELNSAKKSAIKSACMLVRLPLVLPADAVLLRVNASRATDLCVSSSIDM